MRVLKLVRIHESMNLNKGITPSLSLISTSNLAFLSIKKCHQWASLVAQWLRISLPMQGTRVRTLVQEDPTCCEATKPVHHNF